MPELLFIAFALMAGLSAMTLALKLLLGMALVIEKVLAAPVMRRNRPARCSDPRSSGPRSSDVWARA